MTKIFILGLLVIFGFVGCQPATPEPNSPNPQAAHKAWHCPMHPQIVRDHAGNCPICGMNLVPMESADATAHPDSAPRANKPSSAGPKDKIVHIESSVLQKIGVRTEMVDAGTLGREIVADAEGVLDEASETSVTVRTMGYLETVSNLRPGDPVKTGQILATLYSPDLTAAQGDWLASRNAGDSLGSRAAAERLGSAGFPTEALDKLARSGKVQHAFAIASPVSGWVRARSATRGQSVMAGNELFRLVEGSGAVLEARMTVSDAMAWHVGDLVELGGEGLGTKATARVLSVLPQVDRSTRSATVRLAPAKEVRISVGALYKAKLSSRPETGFVVSQDAVLHSGNRDIVFLALGDGKFKPAEVKIGPSSNGKILVRSGLEAGDEVVVSAQFLIDGESRLQAALDQLTASSESAVQGAKP